ncbi:MAG: KEOPS complex subunit Pcc1 [Methanophagales archaeon]|nr:KEOPS complex subunit Pcc1 [Methanophagales archaeon]
MNTKAEIQISGANVNLIVRPLMPDNMANMKTDIKEKSAVTYFEAQKIGSLIASVDDYLMNAKVAQDMVELVMNLTQKS